MNKIIPFPLTKKEVLLTTEELLKFERIAEQIFDLGTQVIEFPVPVEKDGCQQPTTEVTGVLALIINNKKFI